LSGSENRAPAVAFDAPAFKNEPQGLQRPVSKYPESAEPPRYPVIQVSGKLESPPVEAEIENYRSAILHNRDRTKISGPGIVGLHGMELYPVRKHSAVHHASHGLIGIGGCYHEALEPGDFLSDIDCNPLHRIQVGAQSVPAWGQAISTPSWSSHSAGSLRFL